MNDQHPIRLVVTDDLRRSRLTVFFRYLLAIPHLIVWIFWAIPVTFAVLIGWFVALFTGRLSDGLHIFIAKFLRYSAQVTAYINLLANPYPKFGGGDDYPVDLEIEPPARQNRWITGFRSILIIPAYIFSYVLGYVFNIVVLLAWFVCIIMGKMPRGFESLGTYILRYQMQTAAYYSLLTDRYPSLSSEPVTSPPIETAPPAPPAPAP